jgi:hypothetical protein
VHQKEPIEHQNFMVSEGPGLTEFATRDAELMDEEEQSPPKKCLRKSQRIIERKQRCKQLNTHVIEADSNAEDKLN